MLARVHVVRGSVANTNVKLCVLRSKVNKLRHVEFRYTWMIYILFHSRNVMLIAIQTKPFPGYISPEVCLYMDNKNSTEAQ